MGNDLSGISHLPRDMNLTSTFISLGSLLSPGQMEKNMHSRSTRIDSLG